jgi:ABC-type Fe3+-hydroxamate transport system substrate-binding protein
MHAITVKQLAQLGNIPQWQYSSLFQERMGMKPLDYLTELRIGHAKEWLLQSDEPLREIARRVGFTDEYYFNRRFRHTTGMTPRQYSVSMSRKVRIKDWTGHEVYIPRKPERVIYHGESLGDLCALGIRAVGGSAFFANSSLLEHEPQLEMQDIGMPINPGKAEALKPDLIILASADEDQYRALSRIAPTVTHNTHAPLEHRLLTLGQWLGRQREAELWLAAYHERVSAMWRKLHAVIDAGDTASVFIYEHGRRLFVMGTAGLSSSLYHPSGFQATSRIREIVEAVRGFAEISPASLPDYAGDHIFMLLSTNEASRQAAEDMMGSDLWRKLSAVRAGRAYVMEADLWNHGDALSRQKLIQALPRMLGNIS